MFGKPLSDFLSEWVTLLASLTGSGAPGTDIGQRALAEFCPLVGIVQAQVYLTDPTRPRFVVLRAQFPAQSKPPKRSSFEVAGTPFEPIIKEGAQVVPDQQQLSFLPPVPTQVATPVAQGNSPIGLLNIEEAPPHIAGDPLSRLLLFQFGQLVGHLLAVDSHLSQRAEEMAELRRTVGNLTDQQKKLESTTAFLDSEVDRQYFEKLDLEKDREKLVNSFQKFVSPVLIERIRNDPHSLQPGGHKQQVTVFFSDIRGFTRMSEGMDPSRIVVQLNEYFSAMTEIVLAFGGMLDKYVGDEVMALFGAPLPLPDAPVRAVYCALEMQARLGPLRNRWIKDGFAPFQIGFGIAMGSVTVGFIGSDKVLSYTAIGDKVNLASRLCANAKPGEILIEADVAALAGDALLVETLPPLPVKGKVQPVEVCRVLGAGKLPEFVPPDALLRQP